MDCSRVLDDQFLDDYLLGRLADPAREQFELHYFACPKCFAELETRMAVREGLRDSVPSRTWRWTAALAAAAAIAVAVLVFSKPKTGAVERAGQVPPRTAKANPFLELASVQPPRYRPVVLRSASAAPAAVFDAAMVHYSAGRYSDAGKELRRAVELDGNAPAPAFYLGVCLLTTGDTAEARRALEKLVALGDTPYLESAHFFLAKASLRENKPSEARRHLEHVIALRDRLEPEARELLARLDALAR